MSTKPSQPRLHVTVALPPIISFSSIEAPHLEVHMTLEHSQPIIIALKQSRLWPRHLQTALLITHISSGRQEYVPRVDCPLSSSIPRVSRDHQDAFVGLYPGKESVVKVSFRPHDERFEYEKFKDSPDKYRFIFPMGMQFLEPGEEYEVGIGPVQNQVYMMGDLERIFDESEEGVEWERADGDLEIVPGEKCRFRVED